MEGSSLPPDADEVSWPQPSPSGDERTATQREGDAELESLSKLSKTEASQAVKGAQSYYYWHKDAERRRLAGEVPAPMPAPKLLETSEEDRAASRQKRVKPIADFAFLDDGDVVKVYITLAGELEGVSLEDAEVEFGERSLAVTIERPEVVHRFCVEKLAHEVTPPRCKARVTKAGKLVITLFKRNHIERWAKLRAMY